MIFRRQVITLRQTTVEECEVTVLVPLHASASEQRELAIEATGGSWSPVMWNTVDFRTEVVDFHTLDHVQLSEIEEVESRRERYEEEDRRLDAWVRYYCGGTL